jgi:hypothetical protein
MYGARRLPRGENSDPFAASYPCPGSSAHPASRSTLASQEDKSV